MTLVIQSPYGFAVELRSKDAGVPVHRENINADLGEILKGDLLVQLDAYGGAGDRPLLGSHADPRKRAALDSVQPWHQVGQEDHP